MKVRLRILHGTLQDTHGHGAGLDVKVRGPRFVIGNAADCSMCCRSDSVLPHHCELLVEDDRVVIRKLSDRASTFVNGQSVERERVLKAGDHLRLGRLEFQVLIDKTAAVRPPIAPHEPAKVEHEPATLEREPVRAEREPEADDAAEEITELLVQADERDRAIRQEHPELRVLHLETAADEPAPTESEPEDVPATEEAAQAKKKGRKKPGKLPVRPPKNEIVADDSTEAAQEALRRLFQR